MEKLNGQVKKIIFTNEENAYTVLLVSLPDGDETVLVGYIPFVGLGENLIAEGEFKNHKQYGRQFVAESVTFSVPYDKEGIISYLGGGMFKGIAMKTAQKIYDKFGNEIFEILENDAQRLCRIDGITKKRAAEMAERYKSTFSIRTVISELAVYGVSPYKAAKIYRIFGLNSLSLIKKNPYILCDERIGVSFEEADKLAEQFGIPANSNYRVEAGVEYVLRHNLGNGHTFLPYGSLCSVAAEMLSADINDISDVVENMKKNNLLVQRKIANLDAVYLAEYSNCEEYIAKRLLEMSQFYENNDYSKLVDKLEKKLGISYAPLQKSAIIKAAQNRIFILTGGPGTGKTTALVGMVELFNSLGMTYALAAPTGRAAKRMTDITGVEAKTVHRLLETSRGEEGPAVFNRNAKNPIEEEVVIVDEASMLDVKLFEALLRALKNGCRLILVGDVNQLPPVGAGNVLRDMIKSDLFTTVALTEIFRQAQGSLIVVNAHEVNDGNYPECESIESDFFFVKRQDKAAIASTCQQLVCRSLPKKFSYDPLKDIQIITASHKGETGTLELNKILQNALNPSVAGKSECVFLDKVFRVGDKVMQVKNNYDAVWVRTDTGEVGDGIYNGDIGIITEIDLMNRFMNIDFEGRMCEISFDMLTDIELAYAITVHKSQGNEFKCVVMPVYFAGRLTTRNLLYTAITRARETMVLVGIPEAVKAMVDNNKETRRFTGLKYIMLDRMGI